MKIFLFLTAVMGGYFTLAQILYLREFLVIFYGSELSIGLILSLWLTGITAGALSGGHLLRRAKDPSAVFFITISLLTAILVPEIYGIRLTRVIFNIPPGQLIPFSKIFLSASLIILPFTFLAGAFFPAACRLLADLAGEKEDPSSQIGKVYIFESAGSIAAGVIFTYWLVEIPNQFLVIAAASLLISLLSLIAWFLRKRKTTLLPIPILIIAVLSSVFVFGGFSGKINRSSIVKRWSGFNPNLEFTASLDTKYQNLSIGREADLYSVFSNGHFIFSFPDIYQYTQAAHLSLSEHPAPKVVLLIGGGLGGMIEEMLKHPVTRIDYVELDPHLIPFTSPYLTEENSGFLKDKRLKVHYVDGRYFVKNSKSEYDVIVSNVSDPSTAVLNRYFTKDFFNEASGALRDGGVFTAKISSSVDYMGKETSDYSGSVYNSLHSVFPYVAVTPGTENYFFASKTAGVVTDDPKILSERYKRSGAASRYFSNVLFSQIFQKDRVEYVKKVLTKPGAYPLNTDLKPITYFLNLIIWDRYSGSRMAGFFKAVGTVRFHYILIAVAITIFILVILQFRASPARNLRFNTLLALFTTGLAGMALEIALIFMFQNIYGYVYQKIGLIVAAFMAGLTAGGLYMNSYLRKNLSADGARNVRTLIIFEAAILLFSAAMPHIVSSIPGVSPLLTEPIFYFLVFASGFLTGGEFPLAGKIYFSTGQPLGKTAGIIDSMDCFGAAFGAILTGIITLPLFGLVQTCIILAVLKGGCIILLSVPSPLVRQR